VRLSEWCASAPPRDAVLRQRIPRDVFLRGMDEEAHRIGAKAG